MTKPLIFGHRGAPASLPENTLAGFQHCIDIGADGIELDVLLTRDGIPVVTHNANLMAATTRGPDGQWLDQTGPAIAEMTLAELQSFDIGGCRPGSDYAQRHPDQTPLAPTPVPTLDDVLALIAAAPRPIQVLVELKHEPNQPDGASAEAYVEAAAEVVARHDLFAHTVVHAFNWQILSAAARLAPQWTRSHLSVSRASYPDGTLYPGSPWLDGIAADADQMLQQLADRGAGIWSPYFRDLTPRSLELAQRLGLQVMTWTVNDTEDLNREIQRGLDGVITDCPKQAVLLRDAPQNA